MHKKKGFGPMRSRATGNAFTLFTLGRQPAQHSTITNPTGWPPVRYLRFLKLDFLPWAPEN